MPSYTSSPKWFHPSFILIGLRINKCVTIPIIALDTAQILCFKYYISQETIGNFADQSDALDDCTTLLFAEALIFISFSDLSACNLLVTDGVVIDRIFHLLVF